MAGRHRESPWEEGQGVDGQEPPEPVPFLVRAARTADGVGWRRGGAGGLILLVGVVAATAVAGGAIVVAAVGSDGGETPLPAVVTTRAAPASAAPRPRPLIYPTYGEYVPPRPVAPVTRRPPSPTKSPEPTRTRPTCPPDWERVPWLKRWCQTHGYEINDS